MISGLLKKVLDRVNDKYQMTTDAAHRWSERLFKFMLEK